MGRNIRACADARNDVEITAGLDVHDDGKCGFPVFSDAKQVNVPFDVIIDFSHPSALNGVLELALSRKIPAVIATTGLNDDHRELIKNASKAIPVFFTANMSLGVNLISELSKKAAEILGSDFDIEIVEAHHNQKLDAPSGTALLLAESVKEGLDFEPVFEYNRHAKREKRKHEEIGIHSIRGGTIVGEHQVIFAGNDEIVTISHSARSKSVFATGSVNAALFIARQAPGLYSMKDMLK